ncbi:MAG TPA: NUDIX domain-containing protein [Actinopolymorphaceae bacterium]
MTRRAGTCACAAAMAATTASGAGTETAEALPPRVRLLIIEDERIAMIRRVRAGRTYYVLPGGGVEPGETVEQTGVREAYEELGVHVELDRLRYDETFGGQRNFYYDAHIVGGEFGTGTWPDHADWTPEQRHQMGTYEPLWVRLDDLAGLDLGVPLDLLLSELPVVRMDRIDHLVLTVSDAERSRVFYSRALGLLPSTRPDGHTALMFGRQRIHLQVAGREHAPHAASPTPGSADLCFVSAVPLDDVAAHLDRLGIPIELGPVEHRGALGTVTSLYLRDPDGNLVEVSTYDQG